jgi:uncharacterized protein
MPSAYFSFEICFPHHDIILDMTTLDKVKKVISEEKDLLSKKYNVSRIGIFGSVVRGDDTANSDVDMLVDFSKPVGLLGLVDLESYLSEKIGKKVEIASRKYLSPYIKENILKDEQIIYG